MAALFFTFLDPLSTTWTSSYSISLLLSTLRKTISTILDLVDQTGGYTYSRSGRPTSHCALNLTITSGTQLLALRFADPPERDAPSLYWSTVAGGTLDRKFVGHPDGVEGVDGGGSGRRRRERGEAVVVSSEPVTRGEDLDWRLMESGEVLLVDEGELKGGRREGWSPRRVGLFE